MKRKSLSRVLAAICLVSLLGSNASAQQTRDVPPPGGPEFDGPPPGGPGRFGGPPTGVREDRKIAAQFDANGDRRLDLDERKAAREFLAKNPESRGPGGRGPRGPRGPRQGAGETATPGPKVTVAEAKTYIGSPLYASNIVRTYFLEFEAADWEKELSDFHGTDVEVPAKLTVDGRIYTDVGVHFRGSSSYMMVGEGRKRSLNLSMDFVRDEQRLLGYRTINLLNAHRDASFLRSILYYHIARHYLPAPQANFVKLVVNGESWGIYVNVQQFNKDFIKEWFSDGKGARWKVPGSPRGNAGLSYLGTNVVDYKSMYELKTRDDPKSWSALIDLCRTLNETPLDRLEAALAPKLDLDQVLSFLAIENVFINSDGYWTRASDYEIYLEGNGRFHVIPYDSNETFNVPESGGRMRGGDSVRGVELDPFAGGKDTNKPLLSRLLEVPSLRQRYLTRVREIATHWLDWNRLGPIATQYHSMIDAEVKADTRKLSSYEAFQQSLTKDSEQEGFRGRETVLSLKGFAEQRRAYLLNHPEIKKLPGAVAP